MTASAEKQETDQLDAPLDRAEILRLVKASRNAGYSSTPEGFTQPKQAFKSLSIKEMAALSASAEAEREKTAAAAARDDLPVAGNTPDMPADDTASRPVETAADAAASDRASGAQGEVSPTDKSPLDNAVSDEDEAGLDAPETAAPDAAAEGSLETIGEQVNRAAGPADDATGDTADGEAASFDEIKARMDAVSRLKPETDNKTENPEYLRGVDDGRKAALAEMDDKMNEAIAAFRSAAEAISKDDNIDLSQLSRAMSRAITELASERAGMAIDSHPDAFAARIETMVSRIRNRVDEPVIRLHPADADLIGEKIRESLQPRSVKVVADEKLKRGDARIDVGSIGVMDLIDAGIDVDAETPAETGDTSDD